MCGIAGYWSTKINENAESVLRRMTLAIAHRGPDADGAWLDIPRGVALGHRRLAIVDLTDAGRQPMCSADGRYTIVFNGEIYNFQELRQELESIGHKFRGHSDTEVMLAAFVQWGIDSSLKKFVGMFAFAVWDANEKTLTMARDRVGKKPLYYTFANGAFVFGSELKSLRAFPGLQLTIDRKALTKYLRFMYFPAPYTVYESVKKLEAAHWMTVGFRNGNVVELEKQCYWDARESQALAVSNPLDVSIEEATNRLDHLLGNAVDLRMIADVPLGAFLSGGIDSSLVVAIMQAHSKQPVRTFTIGFHEAGFNEAMHAKAVASHLGTDHTEVYLTPRETFATIPLLPEMYDEPFADPSQIPTYLVSAVARRHVTVALSGDGGDEGFCGYGRYVHALQFWKRISHVPRHIRAAVGFGVSHIPERVIDGALAPFRFLLPPTKRAGLGLKAHRHADRFASDSPESLYRHLMSYWLNPDKVVVDGSDSWVVTDRSPANIDSASFANLMMLTDTLNYLTDDILVKVDRASMAVSLEVRAPLLDHRILEFAWRLPFRYKMQGTQGKIVLREVLQKYVPKELFDRPKVGFGVPLNEWLRGPLRDWAEELLGERRLKAEGYFHPKPIRTVWAEHLAGHGEWGYRLWGVLMFQAWLERQSDLARGTAQLAKC